MASLMRVALIVLSDKAAAGKRVDECLPAMRSALPPQASVVTEEILADDRSTIAACLKRLCDEDRADVIFTSGGTGLGPRDVTPQATLEIADYVVPGIGEAMRAATVAVVPTAILSRAIAVVRGRTLVINLPGSPKAVRETLAVIGSQLAHAVGLLRGDVGEHS